MGPLAVNRFVLDFVKSADLDEFAGCLEPSFVGQRFAYAQPTNSYPHTGMRDGVGGAGRW
jgi:hypothetical protein